MWVSYCLFGSLIIPHICSYRFTVHFPCFPSGCSLAALPCLSSPPPALHREISVQAVHLWALALYISL